MCGMKNLMMPRLLMVIVLSLMLAFVAYAQPAPVAATVDQLVDVGGGRLWMESAGSGGGPTVVLDYGLGGPVNTWQGIFPEIAKFTRVVQYHRAGYGRSDAPWGPYSFTIAATQLRTMLQQAKIPGPYVLVAHSLGNAHIRAFAHLYPQDVAGLVFIDPVNARVFDVITDKERAEEEEWTKEFMQRAPAGGKAELMFVRTEDKDLKTLRAFKRPPDVPMVVLVAGKNEAGPVWTRSVIEEYGPWVYEGSEAGLVVDATAGHYIHRDSPELVISSIRSVVFPSVSLKLQRLIKEKGVEAAIAGYREMRASYPGDRFRESDLNTLGYQRLREKDVKGAIALFELNVEMFPKASNPYDSLAEAYMADGQKELAIKNYKRSIALDPTNTNAVEMLKKLGSQ
jgi:pimeloyl-ACP methyl ester carboxylesterase